MNRIDPGLFSAAFTSWVRQTWPDKPDFVAIDGKTSRRSHDRGAGKAPLHLVSAFATTARLVLGQEAVADKSNETTAIPVLVERLAANDGLRARSSRSTPSPPMPPLLPPSGIAGADYLLAVKANQPTLRAEIERYFDDAPADSLDSFVDLDKGHGRIEERTVTVSRETGWLERPAPLSRRTAPARRHTIVRVSSRIGLKDKSRFDTRYFIASAELTAERAAHAVRGHWLVENALHWTLDVVFNDDQSRLRNGYGALNMAIVRHSLSTSSEPSATSAPSNSDAKRQGGALAAILGELRR
ncbi:ISAs1 family transposase [Mesorhizobium sp. BHbsci]